MDGQWRNVNATSPDVFFEHVHHPSMKGVAGSKAATWFLAPREPSVDFGEDLATVFHVGLKIAIIRGLASSSGQDVVIYLRPQTEIVYKRRSELHDSTRRVLLKVALTKAPSLNRR